MERPIQRVPRYPIDARLLAPPIKGEGSEVGILGGIHGDIPRGNVENTDPGHCPDLKMQCRPTPDSLFDRQGHHPSATINLVVHATTADGKTCSNESRYRRFQDFFLRFSLCVPSVARIILTRIPTQKDGYLPASEIKALTMDREFIAKKWLQWLESQNIGCHLIVISTRFGEKEALAIDQKRWGIERLFGHLKKNGFDLEGTHITKGVKREKLFALVVLAFLFSLAGGSHLREQKIKTSAASHRKSSSDLGSKAFSPSLLHGPAPTLPIPISWISMTG